MKPNQTGGVSLRGIARWTGAFLILAGLLILLYAGLTYAYAALSESDAEAHVPGQATEVAAAPPTAPPVSPTNTATASATVTSSASLTIVPLPTQPPSPTQVPVTATPTATRVIPARGLPRGKGAAPARLVIPRLNLDTRVDEATWALVDENGASTSEWQIPFDAVGHLSTTAKPGEAGNAVISGHHNLVGPNRFGLGKFAGLWNLQDGDSLYIYDALGRVFQYRVSNHFTLKELGEPLSVRQAHALQILKDTGAAIATLETCWNGAQAPLSGNTYRWIVVAILVGTVDSNQVPNASKQTNPI